MKTSLLNAYLETMMFLKRVFQDLQIRSAGVVSIGIIRQFLKVPSVGGA
jgi:hypothetical protein